jgi:hypothetical protein
MEPRDLRNIIDDLARREVAVDSQFAGEQQDLDAMMRLLDGYLTGLGRNLRDCSPSQGSSGPPIRVPGFVDNLNAFAGYTRAIGNLSHPRFREVSEQAKKIQKNLLQLAGEVEAGTFKDFKALERQYSKMVLVPYGDFKGYVDRLARMNSSFRSSLHKS